MITGLDLVRLQIEIAAGRPLALRQEEIFGRGHAIECRIYAEDPENGFFPSPGRIEFLKEPAGPGIRNDCGVYEGFEVPVEYDPILAKLVVHAQTRELAIRRMIRALQEYVILGLKTPVAFLIDVLSADFFQKGETYTNGLDVHFAQWKPAKGELETAVAAYLADTLLRGAPGPAAAGDAAIVEKSLWQTLGNWRL